MTLQINEGRKLLGLLMLPHGLDFRLEVGRLFILFLLLLLLLMMLGEGEMMVEEDEKIILEHRALLGKAGLRRVSHASSRWSG